MDKDDIFKIYLSEKIKGWALVILLLYGKDYADCYCSPKSFLKDHPLEDLWKEFQEIIERAENDSMGNNIS